MPSTATARKNASRWNPPPSQRQPTPRDIEAFKLLASPTHPYLTTPHFWALLGGDDSSWRGALQKLAGDHYIERVEEQRQHANALSRPMVYCLGARGAVVLKQLGIDAKAPDPRPRSTTGLSFAHELMWSELMASLEIGAKETGTRLITWPEIVASGKLPAATKNPYPIRFTHHGEEHQLFADGFPFGVEIVDGKAAYLFAYGIEADTGTMPIVRSERKRASIIKKFEHYLTLSEQRAFRSHYNFPNAYIPIVTVTQARKETMMECLYDLTGGKGSRYILFSDPFPTFNSFERPKPPSGFMLTQNYQRVGYPDFNFLTS